MRRETPSSRSPTVGSWGRLPAADGRTATASGVTTLTILGVAFGALALDIPYFWIVFPVGFGGVLPLVLAYSRRERHSRSDSNAGDRTQTPPTTVDDTRDDALQTLRARYARGELTDDAFESRLERLLETESIAWARGVPIEGDGRSGGAERE